METKNLPPPPLPKKRDPVGARFLKNAEVEKWDFNFIFMKIRALLMAINKIVRSLVLINFFTPFPLINILLWSQQ